MVKVKWAATGKIVKKLFVANVNGTVNNWSLNQTQIPLNNTNHIVDEVLTHIILACFITSHVFEVDKEINRYGVHQHHTAHNLTENSTDLTLSSGIPNKFKIEIDDKLVE